MTPSHTKGDVEANGGTTPGSTSGGTKRRSKISSWSSTTRRQSSAPRGSRSEWFPMSRRGDVTRRRGDVIRRRGDVARRRGDLICWRGDVARRRGVTQGRGDKGERSYVGGVML